MLNSGKSKNETLARISVYHGCPAISDAISSISFIPKSIECVRIQFRFFKIAIERIDERNNLIVARIIDWFTIF